MKKHIIKSLALLLFATLSQVAVSQEICGQFWNLDSEFNGLSYSTPEVDSEGNIYNVSFFSAAISLRGTNIQPRYQGSQSILVTKVSSSGQVIWWKTIPGIMNPTYTGIALKGNQLVIAGSTRTINVQNNDSPITTTFQPFVYAFNTNGDYQWHRLYSSALGNSHLASADHDSQGNIYLTGQFNGPVVLDGSTTLLEGENSALNYIPVIKLNSSGNVVYAFNSYTDSFYSENTNSYYGRVIHVDKDDNVILGGHYNSLLDFQRDNNYTINYNQRQKMFLAKFNGADASMIFLSPFYNYSNSESIVSDRVLRIITDEDAQIYVGGVFFGGVAFGLNWIYQESRGDSDMFIVKLDPSGLVQWLNKLGGSTVSGGFEWLGPMGFQEDKLIIGGHAYANSTSDIEFGYGDGLNEVTLNAGENVFQQQRFIASYSRLHGSFIQSRSIRTNTGIMDGGTVYGDQLIFSSRGFRVLNSEKLFTPDAANFNVTITIDQIGEFVEGTQRTLTAVNPGATTYQWFRNGAFLNGENNQNLTITTGGQYKVIVTNANGCNIQSLTNTYVSFTASLAQDSLQLVNLYQFNDGPNWRLKDNWLTGPLNTWHGVTVSNNRVTELNLASSLSLNRNISAFANLNRLTELQVLNLSDNSINSIFDYAVPPPSLYSVNIANNNLVVLPFNVLSLVEELDIRNNSLSFQRMETVAQVPFLYYFPQNNQETFVNQCYNYGVGSDVVLGFDYTGENTEYAWYYNNTFVYTGPDPFYYLPGVLLEEAGQYRVEVSNSLFPLITFSHTYNLSVIEEYPPVNQSYYSTSEALYQGNTIKGENSSVSLQLQNDGVFYLTDLTGGWHRQIGYQDQPGRIAYNCTTQQLEIINSLGQFSIQSNGAITWSEETLTLTIPWYDATNAISGISVLKTFEKKLVYHNDVEFTQIRGTLVRSYQDEYFYLNDNNPLLSGPVHIAPETSVILGYRIWADPYSAQTTYLASNKRSFLYAYGIESYPVVISSLKEYWGNGEPGDWGGIVVNGASPLQGGGVINPPNNTGEYGGDNDYAYNLFFKHVRVEYAGKMGLSERFAGIQANALGFQSLLRDVQVYKSAGNGIEINGGSFKLQRVMATGNQLEQIKIDRGWQGFAQYIVAEQNEGNSNRAISSSNNLNNQQATPISDPRIFNYSILGSEVANSMGLYLSNGTYGYFANGIIHGFDRGVSVANQTTMNTNINQGLTTLTNTVFWNNQVNFQNATSFSNNSSNLTSVNPNLSGNAGIVVDGARNPSNYDAWFESANYMGAVDPNANWTWYWSRRLDGFINQYSHCDEAIEIGTGAHTVTNYPNAFKFIVGESLAIEITTVGLTEGDTYLEVYDNCGNEIFASADNYGGTLQTYLLLSDIYPGQELYFVWRPYYYNGEFSFEVNEVNEFEFKLSWPQDNAFYKLVHYYNQFDFYFEYEPTPPMANQNTEFELVLSSTNDPQTFIEQSFYSKTTTSLYAVELPVTQLNDIMQARGIANAEFFSFYWSIVAYDSEGNPTYASEIRELSFQRAGPAANACTNPLEAIVGINEHQQTPSLYSYVMPQSGELLISSIGTTNVTTYLEVYTECGALPTNIAFESNGTFQSEVLLYAEEGTEVFIFWDNLFNTNGFEWNLQIGDDARESQQLTFNSIANFTINPSGSQINLSEYASVTSGLPITYSIVEGDGTINGSILTINSYGAFSITAIQEGDAGFLPSNSITRNFTVAGNAQSATYSGIENKNITDVPFQITATLNSAINVNFEIVSGPASISNGNLITLSGQPGIISIKITNNGNNFYLPFTDNKAFNVIDENKLTQSITFSSISDKTFGNAPFNLNASATSGLDINYVILNGNVSINNAQLTILGSGNVTIRAEQNGNEEYNPATPVDRSFVVNKANQELVISSISSKLSTDQAFTINYSIGSGLPVNFSVVSGPATISGTTVTLTGATGTVIIRGTNEGDDNYLAITEETSFTVTQSNLLSQSIVFTAIPNKIFGDNPFSVSAVATSDLPVTLSVTQGQSLVQLNDNIVTILGGGQVTIQANQAGNSQYAAATPILRTFTINKASQTISFNTIPDKQGTDAAFNLVASSNVDLPITFEVLAGQDLIELNGAQVSIMAAGGEVTIQANQAGNDQYNAANPVVQKFNINKVNQTITFEAIAEKVLTDNTFTLNASASSGLVIAYLVTQGQELISINGTTVTMVGVGPVSIQAVQAGNGIYNAAMAVSRTFTIIDKQSQSISFVLSDKEESLGSFALEATATSGLTVNFQIVSGPGSINGSTFTINGPGVVTIQALNEGNNAYFAATPVSQTICIIPNKPVLSRTGLSLTSSSAVGNQWYKNGTVIAGATGTSYEVPAPGNYSVKVTIEANCESVMSDEAEFYVLDLTNALSLQFVMYPNPVNDVLNLTWGSQQKIQSVQLLDLQGRIVFNQAVQSQASELMINLTDKPHGMYLLIIKTDEGVVRKNIVKQ